MAVPHKNSLEQEAELESYKSQISGWSNGLRVLFRDSLEAGAELSTILTIIDKDIAADVAKLEAADKFDFAGQPSAPATLEYMATDFVISPNIVKSFLTLVKWDCQSYDTDLDDLIAIQNTWLKYGYKPYGKDTAWVLVSLRAYLKNAMQRACTAKNGLRAVMILSVLWQLQTAIDQTYRVPSDNILKEYLAEVGCSGYFGFVMVARIARIRNLHDEFDIPQYTQSSNSPIPDLSLKDWMQRVPVDGTFAEALAAPALVRLAEAWHIEWFSDVDSASGWKLIILCDDDPKSWFHHQKTFFIKKSKDVVVFNTVLYLHVGHKFEVTVRLQQKDEGGFLAQRRGFLNDWLDEYCADALEKATDIAIEARRTRNEEERAAAQ